ncbi:hypothetical protein GCM10023186_45310 [Hymenobacter koreensis]|uniref:Uncharacterized protein n=1 Tax=Hymenobacter koreensis TaxID=1084523 RepID=A0ABP8JNK9_9BACT
MGFLRHVGIRRAVVGQRQGFVEQLLADAFRYGLVFAGEQAGEGGYERR